LVSNLTTGAVIRVVGKAGVGTTVGATAEFQWPTWPGAAPWSNTTVLVGSAGNSNYRFIEVDVVSGLLVKIWFTAYNQPYGIAATASRIVVTYGGGTGTTWISMHDLSGNILWSVGGTELLYGTTTNVGVLLGTPIRVLFSQDGSYLLVAEYASQRVTKWNAVTGAYIASIGSGYDTPADVIECWTGTGVGTLVIEGNTHRLSRVSETGVMTTSIIAIGNTKTLALVPGQGLIVGSVDQGMVYLRSVAFATHPANVTVTVGSTATFTVSLTANSATTGMTYVWTKGGVVVGTNSATLSLTTINADGGWASVVCTVTHAMGQATSNAGHLIVQASA
jgi:hypothetical protein